MNSGRAPTLGDIVLFAVVVAIALLWATTLSPGSVGALAIGVPLLLVLLVAVGVEFLYIYAGVSGRLKRLTQLILSNRRACMGALPEKWRPKNLVGLKGFMTGRSISYLLFFLGFLFYFVVMAILFYGLGGPPLSDPYRLMAAAFLGTSVVHFSGHIEGRREKLPEFVLEFLVPFGIIVGAVDWVALGSPNPFVWLGVLGSAYVPVVLLFFAAYICLDAGVEWYLDHRKRRRSGESGLPKEGG